MNRSLRIALFVLLVLPLYPQQKGDVPLVTVGPITITREEFVNRYEMTPALNRRAKDIESGKAEFLLSMIAEKLLVLKARENGWENDSLVLRGMTEIEQMLARDEFYRREVTEKVTITEQERQQGLKRSLNDLKVYFLYAKTKEGADFLMSQLRKGKPLETFSFDDASRDEFAGPDSAIARWGDVDERMERVIYGLKLNETSAPVQLDDGWYIVKLMGKTVTVLAGEKERKGAMEKVDAVLRKRKELVRMAAVMKEELKGTRTEMNARLLKGALVHLWQMAVHEASMPGDTGMYFIDHGRVDSLRARMGDSLRLPLITFPHTVWTAEQAFRKVAVTNLAVLRPTVARLRADVEQRLRDLIDQEYLTRAAYRTGMHQTASVREQLRVWRESFIAQSVRNRLLDTVTATMQEVEELRMLMKSDSASLSDQRTAEEKVKQVKGGLLTDRFIGTTANETVIIVFEKNFEETSVTGTTAMVFRYLGFGGRMFAVPLVLPQTNWVRFWDQESKPIP
ncbi:MAG: peptidylprolyl isomerase [Bacteroidetes bacterium]|nr:peptidylprolyl isomerase [Bacteroidota bacterium]